MQKMIFEAFFSDEVASVLVSDSEEEFAQALASGVYHMAFTNRPSSSELKPDESTRLFIWDEVRNSDIHAEGEYQPENIFRLVKAEFTEDENSSQLNSPQVSDPISAG